MISQINVNRMDTVSFDCLNKILSRELTLKFKFDDNPERDYSTSIHSSSKQAQVQNNFCFSENPHNNTFLLRPFMVEPYLIISVSTKVAGQKIYIKRSGAKIAEKVFSLDGSLTKIEFIPVNNKTYSVKFYYDGAESAKPQATVFTSVVSEPEPQHTRGYAAAGGGQTQIEPQAASAKGQPYDPDQHRQSQIRRLEQIEAEYQKDYDTLNEELEDIKDRMEADASIIEYYMDHDIQPVEKLLEEAKLKLEEAEKQIRLFIQAKQKKTMEIEAEVKSNKK